MFFNKELSLNGLIVERKVSDSPAVVGFIRLSSQC